MDSRWDLISLISNPIVKSLPQSMSDVALSSMGVSVYGSDNHALAVRERV